MCARAHNKHSVSGYLYVVSFTCLEHAQHSLGGGILKVLYYMFTRSYINHVNAIVHILDMQYR